MTKVVEFKGVGGTTLKGQYFGNPDDPAVVLLEQAGIDTLFWGDLAVSLVKAGRYVVCLAHLDVGELPSKQNAGTFAHESLRSVLCQLPVRPVILAFAQGAVAALDALGDDAGLLATGLVLLDPIVGGDTELDVMPANFPVLIATGIEAGMAGKAGHFAKYAKHAEAVEILVDKCAAEGERFEAFTAILIDFLERRLPRAAPEYRLGSDARTLRDALGCFATGVTIITGNDANGLPVGLTANSFTSVSLDPPLLLACIAKTATSAGVFQTADRFAVNVLHIGQQPTSIRFSRRDEDRFGATPWELGLYGTPVLTGSLATFECARHAVHDGGDHIILIGQVERARFEPRRDPLLYFRGKYRRLHFS